MKRLNSFPCLFFFAALSAAIVSAEQDGGALKEGAAVDLGGRTATLKRLDTLPFVESDYTKRFAFDAYDNPKLKELREHYKLDDVVAPGKDEFDKQVLLMNWTHHQFKKFGAPSAKVTGALEILKAIEEGNTFFCAQYGDVLVSSAASLGWVDRELALRRHQNKKGVAPEHTSTEIWSNQFRKWVMLDPTANLYVEKDGVPQSAYEIRQEWFYHEGKDLVFVLGNERKKYKKSDLPVFVGRFAGFGDLRLDPDEMDKYGFTAYIPNTNLMNAPSDYGKMFIVKDKMCEGTKWHERTVPANPAVDAYFPIGQAALSLGVDGSKLAASLKTMTPNFKAYLMRIDGGDWKVSADKIVWDVHPGSNRLEAKTINQFGVEGPVSTADVEVAK